MIFEMWSGTAFDNPGIGSTTLQHRRILGYLERPEEASMAG